MIDIERVWLGYGVDTPNKIGSTRDKRCFFSFYISLRVTFEGWEAVPPIFAMLSLNW